MRMRESISNLIALALLLGGAALLFVWLADTVAPAPEPAAGALRPVNATATSPALAGPILPSPTSGGTRTPVPPLFTPTPWSLNPERLHIVPLYPARAEEIVVEVYGTAPADCPPELIEQEVLETGFIPIDLAPPAGAPCTAPSTPWTVTTTLAPLPPGHWLVEIYLDNGADRTRYAAHTVYVAPPGPTPVVTPTTPGDVPTRTPMP